MIIEQLKIEDIEQYKYLIDECFDGSNNIECYKEKYNEYSDYMIFVAKENERIIASVTAYKIDLFTFSFQPALEIFNVAVLEEYRRKHTAKTLFEKVIEYAKDNNYQSIYLTCLDTAFGAHKLYESLGFKKMSSVKYSLNI